MKKMTRFACILLCMLLLLCACSEKEEGKIEVFINTHMGLATPEETADAEATAAPAK